MNIFSLSHLLELVKELPDPKQFINANRGRRSVIRLPVRDWDGVRDADHPDREFEAHENPYVEFEIIQWKKSALFPCENSSALSRNLSLGAFGQNMVGLLPLRMLASHFDKGAMQLYIRSA